VNRETFKLIKEATEMSATLRERDLSLRKKSSDKEETIMLQAAQLIEKLTKRLEEVEYTYSPD